MRVSSVHLLLSQGPHDFQPETLGLGVHEESEDNHGVDEGASGAEVSEWILLSHA